MLAARFISINPAWHDLFVQEWIPDTVWLNVLALDGMDAFRGLPDAVARGDAAWRAWCGTQPRTARHYHPQILGKPVYQRHLVLFF